MRCGQSLGGDRHHDGPVPEHQRAERLLDRRLSSEQKRWWETQRLRGLCAAFRQECENRELKLHADRLNTLGGIRKLKRLLANALPSEYRIEG